MNSERESSKLSFGIARMLQSSVSAQVIRHYRPAYKILVLMIGPSSRLEKTCLRVFVNNKGTD